MQDAEADHDAELGTLVVRTVLVPAVAVKLGDAFWWPRKLHDAV